MSKLIQKQKMKKFKPANKNKLSEKRVMVTSQRQDVTSKGSKGTVNKKTTNKNQKIKSNPSSPKKSAPSEVKKSEPPPIIKKSAPQASSKLPGIHNFWQTDSKPVKRSAPDDDDTTKDLKKQRLTGAERYQRYIDEEERIRKIEDELADPDHDPHTPDQFERALMKDRNSSFTWIKYMAFHLETAETEKARAVAKKAIASINFREEGELLNVWMALLNLEIRFGSEDTYNETLREAVQRNDPFKVYTRTLSVLLEMEKTDEAGQIIETLRKKFKPLPEMWLQVSEAYLKMKNEKMAKELLPKSLLSLKEKDHVEYMVKFALMTSKHGLHDFSQTIFEKILSSYNKKLPIWFTYIDMMTKSGEIEIARSLYERILVIKFPMKKLKTIFQKYIEFETRHGNAGNVSNIKKAAKKILEAQEDDSE